MHIVMGNNKNYEFYFHESKIHYHLPNCVSRLFVPMNHQCNLYDNFSSVFILVVDSVPSYG